MKRVVARVLSTKSLRGLACRFHGMSGEGRPTGQVPRERGRKGERCAVAVVKPRGEEVMEPGKKKAKKMTAALRWSCNKLGAGFMRHVGNN